MAVRISNMNDLQKALQPVMTRMVDQLVERVYETLNYYLNDYYAEWTPNNYSRTKAFLRSAVKVDAHPYNGGVKASVYIDYNWQSSIELIANDEVFVLVKGTNNYWISNHGRLVNFLFRRF